MRVDEKAIQLIDIWNSKKNALNAVDQIEKALTKYGNASNELQNMDSEFRYWEKVRISLNKI